jgi:predicted metal-binding protein
MKRIFLAMMMFAAVVVCVSCNRHNTNSDSNSNVVTGSETMERIEKGAHHEVWRDKQTGREYFVRNNGAGVCGFELTGRESE